MCSLVNITKAVIHVVPALVSSLRVVAGLQQLANSKLVLLLNHFCLLPSIFKILLVQQDRHYICQPVTIKNRDKIHEKVGFLVKNRDIVKKI